MEANGLIGRIPAIDVRALEREFKSGLKRLLLGALAVRGLRRYSS